MPDCTRRGCQFATCTTGCETQREIGGHWSWSLARYAGLLFRVDCRRSGTDKADANGSSSNNPNKAAKRRPGHQRENPDANVSKSETNYRARLRAKHPDLTVEEVQAASAAWAARTRKRRATSAERQTLAKARAINGARTMPGRPCTLPTVSILTTFSLIKMGKFQVREPAAVRVATGANSSYEVRGLPPGAQRRSARREIGLRVQVRTLYRVLEAGV